MPLCPTCGAERKDRWRIGPLMAEDNPPLVYWKGLRIRLSPTGARMLAMLVRRRKLSDFELDMMVGAATGPDVVKVHISLLRRALQAADIPVRIMRIRNWGYELAVPGMEKEE